MLLDILNRVTSEAGFRNLTDNPEARTLLLEKINQAAEEVWEQTDLPGSLREVTLQVQPNSVLALPPFIGEIRAIRHKPTEEPEDIHDLRPRYHNLPWKTMWRNWRVIGYAPIQRDIENAAPLVLTIGAAEADITVTISGSTSQARRDTDAIVMASTSNTGAISFTAVESIRKSGACDYDITVSDQDGNELAVLYNDQLESRYQLLDVSAYPTYSTDCPDGSRLMEVLYKLPLYKMTLDTDSFPVAGFDHVVALKTLQLLVEGQEGKEERAYAMDQKVTRTLKQKIEHKEGTLQKRIKFSRNRFHNVTRQQKMYNGTIIDTTTTCQ